uniref:Chitin-binding type-2 domain-containing protein n=1 Tax=Biomphalaria glabrata TaxID=6526 RepID=A0A2C9KK24_BIOGL
MNNAMGKIRTFRLQIQCWILPLWIMLTLVSSQGVKETAVLNECDRGVKRHHPSQANLYQIFTRKDYRKQWLDYACPEYMIFDPRTCECAETQRPTETQGQVAQRSSNKGQSLRQPSSRQNSWNADKGNTVTDTLGQRTSGGDCHLHRPSSEDPSHFERWADGKWLQEDCNWPFYTGLMYQRHV